MKHIAKVLFGLCLASCQQKEQIKDLPIMGDLPLGKYNVGYQTLFRYDVSKNGVPYSDWEGNLTSDHQPELGRQHQINVWYPAVHGSGQSINYSDYVDLTGRQTNFQESEKTRTFARETFIDKTQSLASISEVQSLSNKNVFTADQLNKLLELDVTSMLNAEPVNKKFPVVVYPNGGSPAFMSITCEFLASHGYVVVAFTPKGRFSSVMEISTVGLEIAVDDLEFVLGQISEFQMTDMDQVAILANAISASVGVAAISRNEKIKALISLEGGLPSAFEQRLLNESVFYQPENIQVPILMIYSHHPAIDPQHTFHLSYADRYYAYFPNMSEFLMLNYGMFDKFIPDILGEHPGNTVEGFETANELVLRFLDQNLKKNSSELFDQAFLASKNHIDTTFVLPGKKVPPNMADLKDLFWKEGFNALETLYYQMKADGNDHPFSVDFYTDYRNWLAWQKDEEYSYRLRLYLLAFDSYPEYAKVNYYLAYYSMKQKLNEQATKHYRIALELLEEDEEITAKEKKRLKLYAEKELSEL